ncbi:MAG: TonB-dependent receptor, partial [Acidobacteriota bacterium]|nr:TonB-dependent receptor [Acidobacteriota bacterium]
FSDYLAHYQAEVKPRVREEVFASFFLNNSPYQSPYGFSFNKDIRALAEERTTVNAAPWYTAAFGFAAAREELKNTYVVDFGRRDFPLRRNQQGLYWENRFQFGQRFFLNAGVREEIFEQPFIPAAPTSPPYSTRPSLKGQSYSRINPKIAAVYALGSTRFHSSFGTGIRPPGGSDLAFTDNPVLKPEKTFSVDAGVEKRVLADRLSLQATYFYNRYSDQIVGLGGNLSVLGRYRTGNLSRSRSQGAEFAAEVRPARWLMLSGNYTYLDTAVLALNGSDSLVQAFYTLGQQLPRRPKHSGALVSSFQFRRVSANITGYFRGEILDVEPNYGTSGGFYRNTGFQNIGFNLNYHLDHGFTVYGYLRNALDQRYEELLGYPSPLLNFTAGVKWSFPRGRS